MIEIELVKKHIFELVQATNDADLLDLIMKLLLTET